MKKLILLSLIGIFSLNLQLVAQNNNTLSDTDLAVKMTQKMNTDLNLDNEQLKKIEVLNLDYTSKISLAKSNNPDIEILQRNLRQLNTDRENELKKILTPQQLSKFLDNPNGRKCNSKK
jgi:hypothetical protein